MIDKENRWFLTMFGIICVGFSWVFKLFIGLCLDDGSIIKDSYTHSWFNSISEILLIAGGICFFLHFILDIIDLFKECNNED